MRKIETKAQIEKKEKRRQVALSVVLVLLLVMSSAGWALNSFASSSDNSVKYGDLKFVAQNGVWLTEYLGRTFGFVYLPTELDDVSINISRNLNDYIGQPVYIVGDSEGAYELSRNLQGFVLRLGQACLGECEQDFPIKNCSVDSVIVFEDGNETMVYEDENCVYIVGDSVKGADKFLYDVLEI